MFGIVGLLLYSEVQLTGLSLVLQTLFGQGVSATWYVVIAGLTVVVFIFTGGMRSAAFGAVVKDILLLVVLLAIAFTAAEAAGVNGWGGIFDAVVREHPAAATARPRPQHRGDRAGESRDPATASGGDRRRHAGGGAGGRSAGRQQHAARMTR